MKITIIPAIIFSWMHMPCCCLHPFIGHISDISSPYPLKYYGLFAYEERGSADNNSQCDENHQQHRGPVAAAASTLFTFFRSACPGHFVLLLN
ncbi:MAG: hypothetical protein K2P57_08220 [Burkholderiales bacterium]|nr:hypothetical protein [Burkholderiales bacterium]